MDKRTDRGAMWGLLALVVAIGLVGSALANGSALAARGGQHGGGKAGTGSTATLTVSPNPVAAGATFTVGGSGFAPNKAVVITVTGAFGNLVTADGSGAFSYTRSLSIPWTYTFDASQEASPGKWVVKASATLTVFAP